MLNLLRTLRHDPTKLAYEMLEGAFNWNATPLALPGTKALIFSAPTGQTSWGTHAVDGLYIGPTMGHYRCGTFWMTTTRAICIAATSKLSPTHCTIPTASEEDETIVAAAELARVPLFRCNSGAAFYARVS